MIIYRKPEGKKIQTSVNNETLENVESCKYLGTLVKEDDRTDTQIQNRSNIAKGKFNSMSNLLISRRLDF